MAIVQACVLVFPSKIGTGVQTVSGIVDKEGTAFVADKIIFFNCESNVNTLDWGDTLSNSMVDNRGIATSTTGGAFAVGDIGRFGVKVCSTAGAERYSVIDMQADVFFGGNYQGHGYVSAIRSGEFDITWDLQNRGGYAVMCACFAGDGLNVQLNQNTLNGTYSTPSPPQGLFAIRTIDTITTGLRADIGAGGYNPAVGWDTKDGNRAIIAYDIINQSSQQYRGQLTDRFMSSMGSSWGASTPRISSWEATSYTITGSSSLATTMTVFCGADVRCAAGNFQQPTSAGSQLITTGIKAHWVVLCSSSMPASLTPISGKVDFSVGFTDGVRSGSMWVGETSGNVNPIKGARYLSNVDILRFANANAGSTTFDCIAQMVEVNDAGYFVVDWTRVDATSRQIMWFALGEAITPVPPGTVIEGCTTTLPN